MRATVADIHRLCACSPEMNARDVMRLARARPSFRATALMLLHNRACGVLCAKQNMNADEGGAERPESRAMTVVMTVSRDRRADAWRTVAVRRRASEIARTKARPPIDPRGMTAL